MTWADDLETPLTEAPLFAVEAPDGRAYLPELTRAVSFRQQMRILAPGVLLYANANAGKRNPTQARREGITAGVFDYTAVWPGGVAWIELKGYSAKGRAGKLSQQQIDFGNALHRRGFPAACFFRPESAVAWLRSLGAPMMMEVRDAA